LRSSNGEIGMAAPKGNRNAKKGKAWEMALRRALGTYEDKQAGIAPGQALRKIAEVVVVQALSGNKDAITEIANRLDGKPTEHVEGEIRHAFISALTDEQLIAIATGSSDGDSDEAEGPAISPELH
jgi:hypothetical protein